MHYVRVPGQKRIYGVNIKAEPSTRFADWIETNLLKVEASKIRRVVFDNYKIQEDPNWPSRLVLQRGEKSTITRKDGTGPWAMDELARGSRTGRGQAPYPDRCAGRPQDRGRSAPAAGAQEPRPGGPQADADGRGLAPEQGLLPDDGRDSSPTRATCLVSTDEGVVYTLRYGGPVFAEGDELTVGQGRRRREERRAGQERRRQEGEGAPRRTGSLMVTVSFDPAMIAKPESMEPKPVAKPTGPVNIPDKVFAPDPNDPKYLAEQKEAKEKADRDKADYEKKLADGQKKVEELADRFGPWYYVTPGESFRSINLDRAAITQAQEAARRARRRRIRTGPACRPDFRRCEAMSPCRAVAVSVERST